MKSIVHLCVVAIITHAAGVSADFWDDFSNNLATDLAPIISLFGEQVTKQYLCESISWLDYCILAMAPIGVITVVVSAIRVGGSSSLRAFVGRAKEGQGNVEAELLSSTSRDVCELYSNGGITRVIGRPKILEFVYDPNAPPTEFLGPHSTAGITMFEEYCRTENGRHEWKIGKDGIENPSRLPPTLSHNIGILRPDDWWFKVVAIFGLVLQAGVMVFATCVTNLLRWEKDGKQPPAYACPMAITGTILVCLGVFLCAAIVGQCTGETTYKRNRDGQHRSYLCWLQPYQTLGDQTYESFCHIDRGSLNLYTKSERTDQDFIFIQYFVWFAVVTTVIGFILQFVGFRGIHSAVSMAQLGAALVMTMARTGLRARRLDFEQNEIYQSSLDTSKVGNHELDWLAVRLGEEDIKESLQLHEWDPNQDWYPMYPYCSWMVHGMSDTGERILQYSPKSSSDLLMTTNLDAVEKVAAYRRRLAELTESDPDGCEGDTFYMQWGTDNVKVRDMSSKLAIAIQTATTKVFMTSTTLKNRWKSACDIAVLAKCGVGFGYDEVCYFHESGVDGVLKPKHWRRSYHTSPELRNRMLLHMHKNKENDWEIGDRHELEATLGLWSWSLNRSRRIRFDKRRNGDINQRIICWDKTPDEMGWQYWAEDLLPHQNRISRPDESWNPRTVWRLESILDYHVKRFVPLELSPYPDTEPLTQLFGWYTGEPSLVPADIEDLSIWTLPTKSSFLLLCVQEIFGVFVKSLLETMKDNGQISIQETPAGPRLKSHLVSELVDILFETGLVSRDESVTYLLPIVVFAEFQANRTPLWHAATTGHEAMVADLLSKPQFDKDLQDGYGRSPIWQAAANGHSAVVNLLLGHGADINACDSTGIAPLTTAAANGHEKVVQLLLEREVADLHAKDKAGRTALSYAATHGHEAIVTILLEYGADAQLLDGAGFTPLSRAVDAGHEGIVRLIHMRDHVHDMSLRSDDRVASVDEAKIRSAKDHWDYHCKFIRNSTCAHEDNRGQNQPWKQAIRIALLVTGIDLEQCSSREEENMERLHWKDWVSEGSMADLSHHGTIAADLALRYGPQAEIYIARVSERDTDPDQLTPTICEAIKWAVANWKVDIIVLPPWLSSRNKNLRVAIYEAYKKGKIIIAAAEPFGFESRRSYPASSPYVIGIHAVDGRGKDCGISPMPVKGDYNFSTLGVAIEPSVSSNDSQEARYISGASYSAIIAASTAATFLEFARFNLKLDDPDDQEWLCSTEGMREILRLMSVNIDGYNCIAPWTLFGNKSDLKDICAVIIMVVRKRKGGF